MIGRGALAVAALTVLAAGGFWGGTEGGKALKQRFFFEPPPVTAIPSGYSVPNAVIHEDSGMATRLSELWARTDRLVLIVFTPGCASCFAEAQEWERISRLHPEVEMVAVATTPEPGFLGELRDRSALTFRLFRAPDALRREIAATGTPTIYVLDWEGRVMFGSSGITATSDLGSWLKG